MLQTLYDRMPHIFSCPEVSDRILHSLHVPQQPVQGLDIGKARIRNIFGLKNQYIPNFQSIFFMA